MEHKLAQNGSHSTHDAHEKEIGGATQIEHENVKSHPVAKGGFFAKTKRHCARFWWLHIIIFCVCFLIIALCLVYVGMPKIAQHDVNESYLEITEIQFLEPTSDSILMTQKAILHSPSKFTPTLDPFLAANYLLVNGVYGPEPMIYLPMPKIHALHPQSNASVEGARVHIESLDQVTAYATACLTNEEVEVALVGKTTLHLGALPSVGVNYNTTTTHKGLNGLKGFNVTDAKINITETRKTFPNLKGNAYVPNPSVLTIAMGNVTLQLSVKGKVVGTSTIENMTLRPGDNSLPMTAIIDQASVLLAKDPKTGTVEFEIIGNSSVYNGQHLTYYEGALSSNKLLLTMNVTQLINEALACATDKTKC